MRKDSKVQQLKAEIAVQRAEKAAQQAQKSTKELEQLEKTLTSPQVREATIKVVKQAAESAVDNIIKEKKINNEIKVKTAKQLQQQAEGARKFLKNKKKKKKSFLNKKTVLLLLLVAGVAFYLWKNKTKKVIPKKTIIPNLKQLYQI